MAAGSGPGREPLAPGPPPHSPAEGQGSTGEPERPQIQCQILRGHHDTVSSCHFCFEDTKMLSCSHDGTVKLWDVLKGFPIQVFDKEHTAPISECNLTPDNSRVVTSSYDKTVKVWDMETGKTLWAVEHKGIVTSCGISGDGRYVASGSDKDNTIYVFDAVSATAVAHVQGHHKSTITRCCFDPENQRVTSVSYDKTIKQWDMITRSTSITINEGHSNAISDCCFTSDGCYLCTASWDKSLKIWDIKTGEIQCCEVISLKGGHEGSVSSCLFSQDVPPEVKFLHSQTTYVSSVALKNFLDVLSYTEHGTHKIPCSNQPNNSESILHILICKQGSLAVSGGYDRTVAVWDVETGCKKLSLKGHWDWVTDVAISKNKNWILSASKDYTLRLWNIEKMDHIPSAIEIRKEAQKLLRFYPFVFQLHLIPHSERKSAW